MKPSFKKFKRGAKKVTRPVGAVLKTIGITVCCLIMVAVITLTIVGSTLTVFVVNLMDDTSEVKLDDVSTSYTTYIYAKQGEDWLVYDMISNEGEKRVWASLEQIPQFVREIGRASCRERV